MSASPLRRVPLLWWCALLAVVVGLALFFVGLTESMPIYSYAPIDELADPTLPDRWLVGTFLSVTSIVGLTIAALGALMLSFLIGRSTTRGARMAASAHDA